MTARGRAILKGFGITALAALPACKTGEPPPEVPAQNAPAFSASGTEAIPDRWWRAFEDPRLDASVETALAGNFSLESAWQRLREAEAVTRRERSDLFPDLDGFFDAEARRGETGDFDEDEEQLSLGLTASYEVDLWGRIRSRVEAERLRARATYEDYQAAALTLSAEVAGTWYQLIEARNQRELLASQVQTNENVLRLLRARFGSGQVRSVDILRQRQLVEATREDLFEAEAGIAVLEHSLAVLVGETPQTYRPATPDNLPGLPSLPETGLPASLVQRRPDLRQALAQVRAANADLAAAISNQYPRLTLTATLGTEGENPGELFNDWLASLAGELTAPLFDAGQREAEAERSRAVLARRVADYGSRALEAFREVEDALVREEKQRQQLRSIGRQLDLAQQSLQRLRSQYFNGVSDYIDVLDALTEEQQLRRDQLQARRELIELRIGLYRALAGGFDTKRDPEGT